MTVLDEVRSTCAAIAASARFVHINTHELPAYAASLPLDSLRAPQLDPATHYLGEPEATLAYVVTLDAINFGSGYFPHLQKRPGYSGYFTVASSLKDAWPLNVQQLRSLSAAQCADIFGQTNPDLAIRELMGLFARALNDLGDLIARKYGGDFGNLVSAAEHSAERLVSLLLEMPF